MRRLSSYPCRTLLCLALLSACTNGPEAMGGPASPENTAAFRELIAADWELAPGTERYMCVRQVLTETTFVSSWRTDSPFGTHHILLTVSPQPDGEPDGPFECDSSTLGVQTAYGAGAGTNDRYLPAGVAVKLEQGAQALLNLHLFNPTDAPLRGRTGTRVQTLEEKDVREIADTVAVTALQLDVPPGRSTSYARCTFDRDATMFQVAPHMHQTGIALRAVAHTATYGDVVLFDGPYNFENQQGYPLDALQFRAGDSVAVACTYENTTGKTIHFGGSSKDEMCQVRLARFPAGGSGFCMK